MLRRKFLKTATVAGTGLIMAGSILFSEASYAGIKEIRPINKKRLNLRGYGKSGCCTPPELLKMIDGGINCLPR